MSLNRAGGDTSSPGVCPCGCTLRSRRYPSDLTDREWMLLEPVLPPALSGPGRRGRPEKHHRRAVLDAIRYVSDNGIKWRALPTDFPPWRTVYGFFAIWSTALVWEMITDRLRPAARLAAGRNPRPSAAVIDSQSVHRCAEAAGSGFKSLAAHQRSSPALALCPGSGIFRVWLRCARLDDPALAAVAAYQIACALAKSPGQPGEAEDVAMAAADHLAGHRRHREPVYLSVRGALLLHAAVTRPGALRRPSDLLGLLDQFADALFDDACGLDETGKCLAHLRQLLDAIRV